MRKLKAIVITVGALFLMLILIELMIPSARGLTYGLLKVFFPAITEFYLSDWILQIVLVVVGSICLYGTFRISRRAENKLWAVVSGIVSIVSFICTYYSAGR